MSRMLSLVTGGASLASALALVIFARLRYQTAGSARGAWDRTAAQFDGWLHHERCPALLSQAYDSFRAGLSYVFAHTM